jgi:hypothetical protein
VRGGGFFKNTASRLLKFAQCDGNQPCGRCASRIDTPDCIYEIPVRRAKHELVEKIKELEARDHSTTQILQALSSDMDTLPILKLLRRGEPYERIVELLGGVGTTDVEIVSYTETREATRNAYHQGIGDPPSMVCHWTSVTSDDALVDSLFRLYFTWVHPVHSLFSQDYFIESYRRRSKIYCSSALVNALCAMACHLHNSTLMAKIDFELLGRNFSDAAGASIIAEDKCITTIQASAVMFLVHCARGNGVGASSYLKNAANNLSRTTLRETEGFLQVLKNTTYGIRNLNMSVKLSRSFTKLTYPVSGHS